MTVDCSEHPAAWHDQVKPGRGEWEDNPAGEMHWTLTFASQEGKTGLMIRTRLESTEIRAAMLKMGMIEGWTQSLENLQALVTKP